MTAPNPGRRRGDGPQEISAGRKLRTYAAIGLGLVDLVMVVANHVVRDRPLAILDVVFYLVLLGVAVAVFDKEVFRTVSREARKYAPWAQHTAISPAVKPKPPEEEP